MLYVAALNAFIMFAELFRIHKAKKNIFAVGCFGKKCMSQCAIALPCLAERVRVNGATATPCTHTPLWQYGVVATISILVRLGSGRFCVRRRTP
uniref:Putative secreted protein n=1 Tax=Anopheles marajoara TaxID=58244 RepID=A0A2M4C9H5_9DIPT